MAAALAAGCGHALCSCNRLQGVTAPPESHFSKAQAATVCDMAGSWMEHDNGQHLRHMSLVDVAQ